MKNIVLASSSPYRHALLTRLNLPFQSISPDIDETPLNNESPTELVSRLAYEKAFAIAKNFDNTLVIGSNQVATINNRILTKPGNMENAITQLLACSGNNVTFYTSLCVVDTQNSNHHQIVDSHLSSDHCQIRENVSFQLCQMSQLQLVHFFGSNVYKF